MSRSDLLRVALRDMLGRLAPEVPLPRGVERVFDLASLISAGAPAGLAAYAAERASE
jgi:hypothetical protein